MALATFNRLGVERITVGMAIETFLRDATVEVKPIEVLVAGRYIPPVARVKREGRLKKPVAHLHQKARSMCA